MPTNFPSGLDDIPNPGAADALDNPTPALKHATQHDTVNDAVEALEAKVGVDNSAVTSSLDYKARNGSFVRKTASTTTDALAADASDTGKTLALGKACMAIKVATDYPAWVRIYSTVTAQTADAERTIDTDPTGEHGVLLEVLTTTDNLSLNLSPMAACFSLEEAPGTTLAVTVVNKDTVERAITVTVTVIPIEG
jgi:hypothetical protein